MCEISHAKNVNFVSLRQQLMRYLSATTDVTSLSKIFGAINSNYERVNFAEDLLEKSGISIDFREDGKSDEVAVKMREQGNQMFKIKRLKEAWQFYTKSICYAQENSVNLGLAFANRSAVLFEINLYNECLEDIERAWECHYPDHLKPKLIARKNNCTNTSSRDLEVTSKTFEAVPTISKKNIKIQCASDCLQIENHDSWGRFVVASRDIKAGEVLAVECPFATVLANKFYSHCHECIKLCYNLIPCHNCSKALYCSEICKERAFETYHKYECPILETLTRLQLDKLKLLPLKLALLSRNRDSSDSCDDVYRSDTYQEVHNLIANTSKRSVADLFERAFAAAVFTTLVKKHTTFFEENTNSEDVFKERVLLHMQTGPSNFHEITEFVRNSNGVYEPDEIASGVFSFLSLFNHSCCPNVTRFCYGTTLVLRAIEDIPKGQQCFDNYGYHHAVMVRSERVKHLKDQYYFDCVCKACVDDWGLYNDLTSIGGSVNELVPELQQDVEVGAAILDQLFEKLSKLQTRQPCKEFCQVQEIIKQCLAMSGNKRQLF